MINFSSQIVFFILFALTGWIWSIWNWWFYSSLRMGKV